MMVVHLVFGWPVYLLTGKTGGPAYGKTNHFWPYGSTGKVDLFPNSWKEKVLRSDIGIVGVLGALAFWATKTSWRNVGLMYGLPYVAVNFWLVLYTWLQHTDVDVPHFDKKEWTWAKGAFHTIDRPYGPILNFLHHGIGSTHVAHHVNSTIPHYHAKEVTGILKKEYPDLYLYDPTPIHKALWRVAT
jgi:fatty acid desaturase